MNEVERKREEIRKVYSSDTWSAKVDNMSEPQVLAVHARFRAERKF